MLQTSKLAAETHWWTILVPTDPLTFWTAAVAIATFGVVVIALRGLASLRLTRKDMRDRATRESRSMAIHQAAVFSKFLRVEQSQIRDAIEAAGKLQFTQGLQSGEAVFDDPAMYARAKAWFDALPAEVRTMIVFFVNDLEGWAMYFTGALAESELVFGPCAPTFCSLVLQYSPWIVIARQEMFDGYYPNLRALFQAWRAELDAKDKGAKTEAALRSARSADERMAKHRLPPVIGKQVDT